MRPDLKAYLDLFLSELDKLGSLKMLLYQSQNLDKNETRKARFLTMLRTKEPPKVLLALEIVVEHIDYASAYHEALVVPYVHTYLPYLEHDDVSHTWCSCFLNELVNHPNYLFNYRKEQMVVRLTNQLRNSSTNALVVIPH